MTQQYNVVPSFDQPIVQKGVTSSVWYRWFTGKGQGIPPSGELAVSVNASPFTYVAPSGGFVIVRSGTVSALQFMRVGTYLLPFTSGIVPLSKGDSLVVTYSVTPTVIFVPQ